MAPSCPPQPKSPADCGGALRAVPSLYRWARRALWRERRAGGEHDCRLRGARLGGRGRVCRASEPHAAGGQPRRALPRKMGGWGGGMGGRRRAARGQRPERVPRHFKCGRPARAARCTRGARLTAAEACLLGGHKGRPSTPSLLSLGGCPATAVLAALGPDLLRCANHSWLWGFSSRGRMMQSAIVNCTTDFLAAALFTFGQEGSFLATDSVRAPRLERGPRAPYCPKMPSHATLAGLRRLQSSRAVWRGLVQ